jgi:ABC-type branched-subunit amino acid transport system permease subunit
VVASGAAFVLSAVLLGVAGLCAVVLVGEVTAGQIDRARALADAGLA